MRYRSAAILATSPLSSTAVPKRPASHSIHSSIAIAAYSSARFQYRAVQASIQQKTTSYSYATMTYHAGNIPSLKLNDGTSIPMLGYGTGTAMSKDKNSHGIDKERVEQIKTALRVGYYHLDCAEMYNTEAEVGVAIKESKVPRDKLFVTTKVWRNIDDIPRALDESLKKLQLDHVDLYLIHAPFVEGASEQEKDQKLQKMWADMEAVQAAGKTKSIGVSNYLQSHLETTLATAKVVPSINQTEFHLYLQRGSLLDYHRSKGIALAAYGPLTPATKAKGGPCDGALARLAKKYGVGEGEICLRWCIDKGVVAVTTSSKENRLTDYARVTAFKLNPAEVEELDKAGAQKHFRGFWNHKFDSESRL